MSNLHSIYLSLLGLRELFQTETYLADLFPSNLIPIRFSMSNGQIEFEWGDIREYDGFLDLNSTIDEIYGLAESLSKIVGGGVYTRQKVCYYINIVNREVTQMHVLQTSLNLDELPFIILDYNVQDWNILGVDPENPNLVEIELTFPSFLQLATFERDYS